jgi:hypothetical protein
MLLRISLIGAILLGLAVGVINFVSISDKIKTTIDQRDQNAKDRDEQTGLKNKALKELASTKTMLQRTNDMLVATMKERDDAVQKAETSDKAAADANAALAKTKADLQSTQNDLEAWHALGIPIEKIRATLASIKDLTEEKEALTLENKIVNKKYQDAQEEINRISVPDYEVKMIPGLRGTVTAVDPRFEFVVLNIGDKQGVRLHGRFLVSEKGKLISKVEVQSVSPDSCIANVVAGYKLGEIMEGDQALY